VTLLDFAVTELWRVQLPEASLREDLADDAPVHVGQTSCAGVLERGLLVKAGRNTDQHRNSPRASRGVRSGAGRL